MIENKNKLTAILFAFAMASSVCVYANGVNDRNDFIPNEDKQHEAYCANFDHQEIINMIKCCVGDTMDIRIFQSKSSEVRKAWVFAEIEGGERVVAIQLNKETGVYTAMSRPKVGEYGTTRKEMRKIARERMREGDMNSTIFDQLKCCLAKEDVLIIETKDEEIFTTWMEEELLEMEKDNGKRFIKASVDKETGVWCAVSKVKIE